MDESHNTDTPQEIKKTIKDVINKINNKVIEYEVMDTTLSIFDKFEEEPTIGDLEGLLYYAKLFTDDDSSTIIELDNESSTRPDELYQDEARLSQSACHTIAHT